MKNLILLASLFILITCSNKASSDDNSERKEQAITVNYADNSKVVNEDEEFIHLEDWGGVLYYKKKLFTGVLVSYYDNGQLATSDSYKNGLEDGAYESYYSNGQLHERFMHKKGKLHGLVEEYHENGQLDHKCTYKSGVKVGTYESYHFNGQLESRSFYNEQGDSIGVWLRYDENGQ